jgi:Mce-associated membrane protein
MPSPHQLSRRRRRAQAQETAPPTGRRSGDGSDGDTGTDTERADSQISQASETGTEPRALPESARVRPGERQISAQGPEGSLDESPDGAADRSADGPASGSADGSIGGAAGGSVDVAAMSDEDMNATGERAGWWRRPPLPVVLGVLTVILGGLAAWSGLAAHDLRGGVVVRNVALTDSARTSEVKGEVSNAVNAVFSCDYTDLAKTDAAARRLLTGQAVRQYATLFAPVRQQAPKDKLVLTTTVTDSGVTMLQGDRARVLLFADQRNTRTGDGQTTYAAAMLAVNAVRQGGTWKIENIDTLTRSG